MRIIPERDIRQLKLKRKVTTESGEMVKPVKPKVVNKSIEERQVKAIESLTDIIATSLDTIINNSIIANRNTIILTEIANKKQEIPIIKKWRFSVARNSEGFIKEIIAEHG